MVATRLQRSAPAEPTFCPLVLANRTSFSSVLHPLSVPGDWNAVIVIGHRGVTDGPQYPAALERLSIVGGGGGGEREERGEGQRWPRSGGIVALLGGFIVVLYLAESHPALSRSSVDGCLGGGGGTNASGGQILRSCTSCCRFPYRPIFKTGVAGSG